MSSGFNLLSLKKEENQQSKNIYKRHLVVGDDLYSVALYKELLKKFGPNEVALMCAHPFNEQDLSPIGPNTLRGETNINKFKTLFPDVEVEVSESPSEFFKELKWRPFGGRAKSEKLLWNEEFFVEKRADFSIESVFPFLKEEELFSELEAARIDQRVVDIEKVTPTDLAEPSNFKLVVSNGDIVSCENLYWGEGPQAFFDLYSKKADLSDEFVQFCEGTGAPAALYVRLDYSQPVTDKYETLFIPLSYTHEWGHFVGEFKEVESGKQRAEFVTFMDKDATTEDEITKKIRLLKKNLEKIFDAKNEHLCGEFIKLSDSSSCLKIDDSIFGKIKKDWSYLKMVSVNAPVDNFDRGTECFEDSLSSVNSMMRALSRHQEIVHSL
jgi:hypothetical protein